jgi:hypothetical protein
MATANQAPSRREQKRRGCGRTVGRPLNHKLSPQQTIPVLAGPALLSGSPVPPIVGIGPHHHAARSNAIRSARKISNSMSNLCAGFVAPCHAPLTHPTSSPWSAPEPGSRTVRSPNDPTKQEVISKPRDTLGLLASR